MKKLLYSLLAICMASGTSFAQNNWCSADQHYHQLLQKDPSIRHDVSRLFANGVSKSDDTTVYIIPVVFHVVHEYGQEYISDAQIQDAVEVLNRDYRLKNADTSQVIQQFKSVYGDARIEFRLAKIDPLGHCTNGIDRIVSNETRNGDAFVKLSQWDRAKYLNVWICGDMEDGVAGYALYPTAVNGSSFWLDGIVIRHNYIGRIGTGNENGSRALTHEVGHWLGLPHVWGNNNDPGVVCGDDGFEDTPITKGFTFCPQNLEQATICTPGIVENYQNYMDYSYCSHMFTHEQIAAMRYYATGPDGQRNNLITAENHAATGIFLTNNHCEPNIDFSMNKPTVCEGQQITFTNRSWNAEIISSEWTFQDATPSTSTATNPTVVFNSEGNKTVTLTVTTPLGTFTQTFQNIVPVLPGWAVNNGPYEYNVNTIENFQQLRFNSTNNADNRFQWSSSNGKDETGAIALINYREISSTALPLSPEAMYYNTLAKQVNEIIIPSSDLRTSTGLSFSFDYAYATNAVLVDEITESLKVYISRNCGNSWTFLAGSTNSTITGAQIVSGGFAGGANFVPTAQSWATYTRAFNSGSTDDRVMFKIVFESSDYSNNLFIDNIRVNGTLGIQNLIANEMELDVYPNPVNASSSIKVDYVAGNEPVTFKLRSLQGEEIKSITRNETHQAVSFEIELNNEVAAAYYFLEVITSTGSTVKKIAVIK